MKVCVIINPIEWLHVCRHEACGLGFDEYISADGTKCKQVWDDGFVEIFEINA